MTTEAEWAWVAGIFEGEGSIGLYKTNGSQSYKQPRLAIGMTDFDVLDRVHFLTGVGYINGPYARGSAKPIARWVVQNRPGIRHVLTNIMPWLCARRLAKAKEIMEAIKEPEYPIEDIRRMAAEGVSNRQIGLKYRLGKDIVNRIIGGEDCIRTIRPVLRRSVAA